MLLTSRRCDHRMKQKNGPMNLPHGARMGFAIVMRCSIALWGL